MSRRARRQTGGGEDLRSRPDGTPSSDAYPDRRHLGGLHGINDAADEDVADLLRARYEQLVASRGTVDLTPAVARRAGKVNGEHMKSDRLSDLDGADSIVAAHGLLLDGPVLSNDGDSPDVEGLEVVTY